MVPAPITPTRLIVARLGVLGKAVDLGRLALGEEEILLRARLRAAHQLHEQFALFDDAFGIGLLGVAARTASMLLQRRVEAAELLFMLPAEVVEHGRVGQSATLSCRSEDLGSGLTSRTSSA